MLPFHPPPTIPIQTPLPLVSVIIPAYNADRFIAATLESVLTQTYWHVEILLVDDGSTDRTPQIIQSFMQRDPRIRLWQQTNAGVAVARNWAIQQAQGEWIAPLDADDLWYPDYLEKLVQGAIQSSGSTGLVYGWSHYIDERGDRLKGQLSAPHQGHVLSTLLLENFIGHAGGVLIRRSCLERLGGYNTGMRSQQAQGCEDWDLYLRIAEHYEFRVVPEFLMGYRQTATSMSGNLETMLRSHQIMLTELKQRQPEVPEQSLRFSRAVFYVYFCGKCATGGQYGEAIAWFWQAVQTDWRVLTRWRWVRLLLICCIKLGLKRP